MEWGARRSAKELTQPGTCALNEDDDNIENVLPPEQMQAQPN